MRKSVVDLSKRGKVSLKVNERHLNSLALASSEDNLFKLINSFSNPVIKDGKRTRGVNPIGKDSEILEAISGGGFHINGFRNKDIRAILYPNSVEKDDVKKDSRRITRYFKILRVHGIIKKVPRTHRYLLTNKGIKLISALTATKRVKINEIVKLAA